MTTITSPALSLLSSLNPPTRRRAESASSTGRQAVGRGSGGRADPGREKPDQGGDHSGEGPADQSDVDRSSAAVVKAPDLKTLLADPTARKVLLTANGLGDQTDYTALATKALVRHHEVGNLASKLSDTRWLTLAKTYDFANKGLSVLKTQCVLDTITSGYAEVQWRQSLDQTTPGLSTALDFRSRAATITNVYQILGDKNLREVVDHRSRHPEADRLPEPASSGKGDLRSGGHHQIQRPQVRRAVHAPVPRRGQHRRLNRRFQPVDRAADLTACSRNRYSAATACCAVTRAAQNLNSGILPNGSSAGLVSRLAAASA